jgi:FkbM family methyltransferase
LQIEPYRWRLSPGFVAHLWKATTQQHHRILAPTFARLVPRDAVVFDVGAHAGQYAKLLARMANDGHVYAFEPGSYARTILRAAIWAGGIRNVSVLPLALGSAAGLGALTIPVKKSGSFGFGLSHFGTPEDRWPVVSQEIVALTTIDEVAALLDLRRLDFIKADVEGWELRMLEGGAATLARFRPRLLLELTKTGLARAGDTPEAAFAFLAARDYRPFRLAADGTLTRLEAPADGDFWFLPDGDPTLDRAVR